MIRTLRPADISPVKSTSQSRIAVASLFASALLCVAPAIQAAPVSRAEATVLTFNSNHSQPTVTTMTDDTSLDTSAWVNASYDGTYGMVVEVQPGTFSIGFGSYVPENYTGPGAMYLHRVYILDQDDNVILDESFDGWTQDSTTTEDNITRSQYSTTGGIIWATYADTADYYTGLGDAFEAIDSGGDAGMVYPMDGGGPFSVLIRTVIDVPDGTSELRINLDWRYNVSIFSGAPRQFTIGLRQGDVDPEFLFSFSAPPEPEAPVSEEVEAKSARVNSSGGSFGAAYLLMIGLFGLVRSRKIFLIGALLPLPALAQGVYIGAEGLLASTDVKSSDVTSDMAKKGIDGSADVSDSSRGGWRLYGGYPVTDSIAIELGWTKMEDITTRFDDVPAGTSTEQLAAISPQSGSGVELGVRWTVTDQFKYVKPALRAGVWRMEYEQSYQDGNGDNHNYDENDNVFFWGADALLPVNDQWSGKVGVSMYHTEDYRTGVLHIGAIYNF